MSLEAATVVAPTSPTSSPPTTEETPFVSVIHSVSFAEFDINVGNCLTATYPSFTLDHYSHQFLGNTCLPDGAHEYAEDWIFLVLTCPTSSTPLAPSASGLAAVQGATPSVSRTSSDSATSTGSTASLASSLLMSLSQQSPTDDTSASTVATPSLLFPPTSSSLASSTEISPRDDSGSSSCSTDDELSMSDVVVEEHLPGSQQLPQQQQQQHHLPRIVEVCATSTSTSSSSPTTVSNAVALAAVLSPRAGGSGLSPRAVTPRSGTTTPRSSAFFGTRRPSALGLASSTSTGAGSSTSPTRVGTAPRLESDTCELFGLALFRNTPCASVKRGAIQKALLLLMWQPFFMSMKPLLATTMDKYIPDNKLNLTDEQVLEGVYHSLHSAILKSVTSRHLTLRVSLWSSEFNLTLPMLRGAELEGSSLTKLVQLCENDTMVLWYALMYRKRVLFVGQPAELLSLLCISAPLLVSPIQGLNGVLCPYVGLNDLDPILKPHYICGATNPLFKSKHEWFDVLCQAHSGEIVNQINVKMTSADRSFIKAVLAGIHNQQPESWVREQFRMHTCRFLEAVMMQKRPKEFASKLVAEYTDSPTLATLKKSFADNSEYYLSLAQPHEREQFNRLLELAISPPLVLPESWQDHRFEVLKHHKRNTATELTLNCAKAGLQILNRKGELKYEFNYLEVVVSERFEPNPTATTGFTLRAPGLELQLGTKARERVYDELRSRIRYIRCIVASARKTGGAEPRDSFGKTALHLACEANDIQEVVMLLNKCPPVDINAVDWMGNTPLISAAKSGSLDCIEYLLECADIELNIVTTDRTGIVYYLIVLWATHPVSDERFTDDRLLSLLTRMKQKGAHLCMHGKLGETPLHQAIFLARLSVVQWLVENGANPNALNDIGETPLHYAARLNNKQLVLALVNLGADKSVVSSEGQTPLQLTSDDDPEIYALLYCSPPIGTTVAGSNTVAMSGGHSGTQHTAENGDLLSIENSSAAAVSASPQPIVMSSVASKSTDAENDYHSPRAEKRRNLRSGFKLARSSSSNSSSSKILDRERRQAEAASGHSLSNDAHHEPADGSVVEHSADGAVKVTLQGGQYTIELAEGLVTDSRLAESISACVNAAAKKASQHQRKPDTLLGSRTSRIGAFIFS